MQNTEHTHNAPAEATGQPAAPEPPQQDERPKEETPPTPGQIEAQEFDSGPEMNLLRQTINDLPYLSKLAIVLLQDLFFCECQTNFHRAVHDLIRDLHNDVWSDAPPDPQAKNLFDLYRIIVPIRETDTTYQWRLAIESWTATLPQGAEVSP